MDHETRTTYGKQIFDLTGIRPAEEQDLFEFLARLTRDERIELFRASRDLRFKKDWGSRGIPGTVLDAACFLAALRELRSADRQMKRKAKGDKDEILKALQAVERKQIRRLQTRKPRAAPAIRAVRLRLPIVKALKEQGVSWEAIRKFLETKGVKISRVHLARAYDELTRTEIPTGGGAGEKIDKDRTCASSEG